MAYSKVKRIALAAVHQFRTYDHVRPSALASAAVSSEQLSRNDYEAIKLVQLRGD